MSIRTRFNPLGTIGRKSLLPAGYIELEYLESTGTQYIDTGLLCNYSYIIDLDIATLKAKGIGFQSFFGYAQTSSKNYKLSAYVGQNNNLAAYIGNDAAVTTPNDVATPGSKHSIRITEKCFYVDNILYSDSAPVLQAGNGNMYLFARNGSFNSGSFRIYTFKVKLNNKLVLNFIPALDPTGRPCMFDTVTQQPFYNEGTGEFKCGYKLPRGYEQVDFVTFNGATALDTGMHIATPCWFWCDFQPTIYHQDNVLIGYRIDKAQDTRIGFGMSNGTNNAAYFGRGKTFPLSNYRVAMRLDRHTVECRMSLSDVYTAFDGGQLTRVPENQCQAGFDRAVALSSSSHIYIGAAHDGNETQLYWTGKVFGLKFKGENGNVVANIIPARYNGQPCMYDVVRGIKLATVQGNLQ